MTTPLITKAELQLITGVDLTASGYTDEYLAFVLDDISTQVETYCDRSFAPKIITGERHQVRGNPALAQVVIHLFESPMISLTQVRMRIGSVETEWDTSWADIDPATSTIRIYIPRPMWSDPRDIVVMADYCAGIAVPTPVKTATAYLVQEVLQAYDKAKNGGQLAALQSFRVGSYSETYFPQRGAGEGKRRIGLGTPLSVMAVQRLDFYLRSGVVFI